MSDKLITDNDLKKTKEYKDALSDLQRAVNGLTYSMPNFATGLEAGLTALSEKLPEVAESIAKLNAQNKELVSSGQKPQSVLKQLASSLLSWNSVVSVGITLISIYGKEILNWITSLFKTEQGLNSYQKALKESRIVMGAVIEAKQRGNITAQEELVKLKLLYNATQNTSLSISERKKAVDALQENYPAYFKNVKDEIILNGQAKGTYEKLTASIIAAARARAAEEIMVKNEQRKIGNEQRIENLSNTQKRTAKEIDALEQKKKALADQRLGGYRGVNMTEGIKIQIQQLEASAKQTQRQLNNINTDTKLLNKQNNALAKEVEAGIKAHGIQILQSVKTNNNAITNLQKDSLQKQKETFENASEDYLESIAGQTIATFKNYNEQVQAAKNHFDALIIAQKVNKAAVEQLEKEKTDALKTISSKFRQEELAKLNQYEAELKQLKIDNITDAKERELAIIDQETKEKIERFEEEFEALTKSREIHYKEVADLRSSNRLKEADELEATYSNEKKLYDQMVSWKIEFDERQRQKRKAVKEPDKKEDEPTFAEKQLTEGIEQNEKNGQHTAALQQQINLLDLQYNLTVNATKRTEEEKFRIESEYKQKRADLEDQLVTSKIHAGDKYIDAVLKNTKKDSAIYKAAFIAKKATAIADVIISTKKSIIASFEGYSGLPFIGQALAIAQGAFIAAQGAASIAQITKQKPGFAMGGQYISDGKGALLSGYSRNDNTNAYLRSGEAVVVSEAMRNPWARNLVSAINVAHGGRDFSTAVTAGAYALGGVFTDGGNANRYYAQPVNDVKELANTLAYQLINNFPPVYVDVKDINTQQSILANTVDRVNL